MMFQAGTFMLPYRIWSSFEGGLMEEFGSEAKTAIMLSEEFEEAVVIDSLIEKYVKYFRSIWHRNNWYFWTFVVCEVMNCAILYTNYWVTNVFLNGRFYTYGWDVIMYTMMEEDEQTVSVVMGSKFRGQNDHFYFDLRSDRRSLVKN
jgi:chloramphenicol O-acetyltransferase